jgi:hypothetical protein
MTVLLFGFEKDILRLEVSVNYIVLVQVADGLQDLAVIQNTIKQQSRMHIFR